MPHSETARCYKTKIHDIAVACDNEYYMSAGGKILVADRGRPMRGRERILSWIKELEALATTADCGECRSEISKQVKLQNEAVRKSRTCWAFRTQKKIDRSSSAGLSQYRKCAQLRIVGGSSPTGSTFLLNPPCPGQRSATLRLRPLNLTAPHSVLSPEMHTSLQPHPSRFPRSGLAAVLIAVLAACSPALPRVVVDDEHYQALSTGPVTLAYKVAPGPGLTLDATGYPFVIPANARPRCPGPNIIQVIGSDEESSYAPLGHAADRLRPQLSHPYPRRNG